jgi:hypothetical protein
VRHVQFITNFYVVFACTGSILLLFSSVKKRCSIVFLDNHVDSLFDTATAYPVGTVSSVPNGDSIGAPTDEHVWNAQKAAICTHIQMSIIFELQGRHPTPFDRKASKICKFHNRPVVRQRRIRIRIRIRIHIIKIQGQRDRIKDLIRPRMFKKSMRIFGQPAGQLSHGKQLKKVGVSHNEICIVSGRCVDVGGTAQTL